MKKCALIFPGQGSQALGMGRLFYEESLGKEMMGRASEALGFDMAKLMLEEAERLDQTAYTQPAILLVSAMAEQWVKSKLSLDVSWAMGHSLGEFSALFSSGALSLEDALLLVHARGKLMQRTCEGIDAGMMVVLGLEDALLEGFCEEKRSEGFKVWTANYNGEGQIVLAGKRSDLAELEAPLKALGAKRALLLSMSVASHCPLLEGMREEFLTHLESKLQDSFAYPIISNVSAMPYSNKAEAIPLLASQLISPVLYKQAIKRHEEGVDFYVECGHGSVLKGLNRRLSQKPTFSIENPAGIKELELALSKEEA